MRLLWLPLIAVMGCGGAGAEPLESEGTGGSSTGGVESFGGSSSGGTTGGTTLTRSTGGVDATGGFESTGGDASETGGSASGGTASESTGGSVASTGGLPATTGGSQASTGGVSASSGGAAASTGGSVVATTGGSTGGRVSTGGAASTSGTGGAAADPLAPYPAPGCPGFVALRSGGANTCIGLRGRFQLNSRTCSLANPLVETCAAVDDTGSGTIPAGDAVVYVKDVSNLKILRAPFNAEGKCPYLCEAP